MKISSICIVDLLKTLLTPTKNQQKLITTMSRWSLPGDEASSASSKSKLVKTPPKKSKVELPKNYIGLKNVEINGVVWNVHIGDENMMPHLYRSFVLRNGGEAVSRRRVPGTKRPRWCSEASWKKMTTQENKSGMRFKY